MLLWKCFEPKFADGGVQRGTTIREEAGAWRRVSPQVAGSRLRQVTVCLRSCHIVGEKTETQNTRRRYRGCSELGQSELLGSVRGFCLNTAEPSGGVWFSGHFQTFDRG